MRISIQRRLWLVLAFFPFALFAQDGTLNTAFDTTGKVYTPFSSGSHDEAHAVAVQKDGRIVAAGKSEGKFAVARYWPNGLIDSTFGTNGKQVSDMYGGDGAKSILIQPDGKIILAGTGYIGDFTVVRYDTSGVMDPTFSGGYNMAGIGSPCYAWGSALQSDGKIVLCGRGSGDVVVMRFTTTGAQDATFGSGGIVQTDLGGSEEANGVAIQSSGKIVVAGSSNNYSGFLVARYKSNGVLDSTFGTNGKVITNIGTSYDNAYAVAIQADGKILVVGYGTYTYSQFALARYDTTGAIDSTFGTNGVVSTWFGYGHDIAYGVVVQLDGKIVVAGTITNSFGEYDFGVVRYNSDGSYDNTFGGSGRAQTDMGSILDYGNALAITSAGKIVVAGQSLVPTGRYSFALAEYHGSSGPLPVELASFSGRVERSTAELTWSTATETNSYGFGVERRTSREYGAGSREKEWQEVGFVQGAGTSNAAHAYSFADQNLPAGSYQYRLKQVDKNGSFKYSNTVEVEVGTAPKEFTLGQNYPNPFNPTTSLTFTLQQGGRTTVKVFDVLGQEVATIFDEEAEAGRVYQAQFNAAHVASGVYLAILETGGKRLVRKMLLLK